MEAIKRRYFPVVSYVASKPISKAYLCEKALNCLLCINAIKYKVDKIAKLS